MTAKGWMLEGSIGDAQISSLNANKLRAGTIDTAIVTVAGTDGRMQISDNTIRISDGSQVRVQIGKDASDDYTLAVWDADGNLIWDALGATENTIQRKIIRDKMVAEDAAIQALKIDFQSFDTAAQSMGASTWTIIFKVLLTEARTSLIVNATIATNTILGYSAMAGACGGGGLGDIAVRYGYNRWRPNILLITVVLLVVLAQVFQMVGMSISRAVDRRRVE